MAGHTYSPVREPREGTAAPCPEPSSSDIYITSGRVHTVSTPADGGASV